MSFESPSSESPQQGANSITPGFTVPPVFRRRSGRGGRPRGSTKLTDEVRDKMCWLIRKGVYPETAAYHCGIAPRTHYKWMARGRRLGDGPEFEYWAAIHGAFAEWEIKAQERIEAQGDDDWRALAWLLTRRAPKHWSERRLVGESKRRLGKRQANEAETLEEVVMRATRAIEIEERRQAYEQELLESRRQLASEALEELGLKPLSVASTERN